MKVVIVGGVAGGASAAARLRRLDEHAEIIIFERGEYISYANCGLPYYIGGEITNKKSLTLQTPQSFKNRFNIDVRTFNEVIGINREAKTVLVKNVKTGEEFEESYDKLILSPGADPIRPPLPGIDNERIFTLRNIPDTYKIKDFIDNNFPLSAVVVGGGYIGVEMAENLRNAGLMVTIIEMQDHLIAPLDYDMACDVHHYVQKNNMSLMLKTKVEGFEALENSICVNTDKGPVVADMVIMSVGVRPDSKLAAAAGLEVNKRGSIIVDDHMLTNDENIYAVGDAVEITNFVTGEKGFTPLAGPANKQGRIAAANICGMDETYKGTQGSAVLKILDMTVATTGINETVAQAAGIPYEKVYTFGGGHAGYYPGAGNIRVKLIFNSENGKVLGAQVVGFEGVDKRCDVIATAIRAGMTVSDLAELELCYAPPFSSAKDPVNMAGFMAENIMDGLVKQYHWHDVPSIPKDKVTFLDVRTVAENEKGTIEGAIHIPVDELRLSIPMVDKSKPVFLICQSGLRSYVAARMLEQYGYDCYNLAGGYGLYSSVTTDLVFDERPVHPCGIVIE
ncbi:MAG: CoA-disulfide reductase [Ruminococcaceae bacterium]|nr:CoA-disulfide reductase [Oscillospiraceae bacterium]